jgi:hypothetical protein
VGLNRVSETQALSPEIVNAAFEKLKLGFKLSIISIVLFVASPLWGAGFLGFGLIAIYILSVYQRASGWQLLGFRETRTTMLVCAVFLVVYPFCLLLTGLFLWGLFYMLMATGLIFWLPLFPWALYTYVENRSIKELEKRLRINLRSARILALIGIVALVMVAFFGWILHLFALNFPFVSGIFASPFLIASCVLLIKRLRPLSDVPKKNPEPVNRP